MEGAYKRIVDSMECSYIMSHYPHGSDIPKLMGTLFQQTAYYYAVLSQYNSLKKLGVHNFNSGIPDTDSWYTAEIWGYLLVESIQEYYCRSVRPVSEDNFHATFWSKMLEKKDVFSGLSDSQGLKAAVISLAQYEKNVFREREHYMTKTDLKKRYEVHLEMYKIIANNVELQPVSTEVAVDTVLSAYTTDVIQRFLHADTEEAAMGLHLFLGLKVIPALSGGRIQDDRRRKYRLFEPACTCSLQKARQSIDDILAGYAFGNFRTQNELKQYWETHLIECDAAIKRIMALASQLQSSSKLMNRYF